MGNTETHSSLTSSYIHPRLGNIKRVQEKTNNFYLLHEVVLQSQKAYDDWAFELQKIKQISEDILFLPIQHDYVQTNFCGTGGYAKLKFEDYLYCLEPQITNRREIKRPFNEQELLYLFYNLIKIKALLTIKGKSIGQIKPQNIMVNQDGYVKILSHYSCPGQPHRIVNSNKNNQRFFLSPQQCEERYRRKEYNVAVGNQRSQSQLFSIGMTILEAGTLKDCAQVYGFTSQYRFTQNKLRQFLDVFENRYSRQFYLMVRELLQVNPKKRVKAEIILDLLRPHEYNILNLQEINIKLSPVETLTRQEKQQKISIKRLGQSQVSQSSRMESSRLDLFKNMAPGSKVSLGSSKQRNLMMNSLPRNNSQDPFANSLSNGADIGRYSFKKPSHPINYQLINQNSNFNHKQPPQSPQLKMRQGRPQSNDRPIVHSLPLRMNPLQQSFIHKSIFQSIGTSPEASNHTTQ